MRKAGGKSERKQDFISMDQMSDPLMSISPFYSFNKPLGWGAVIPILPMWKLSQPVIWGVTGMRIQILVSLNPDLVPSWSSLGNLFATHQPPQKMFLSFHHRNNHGTATLPLSRTAVTFSPPHLCFSVFQSSFARFPRSQLWPLNTGKS